MVVYMSFLKGSSCVGVHLGTRLFDAWPLKFKKKYISNISKIEPDQALHWISIGFSDGHVYVIHWCINETDHETPSIILSGKEDLKVIFKSRN